MKLVLRDIDPEVVLALTEAFGPHHNVSVGGGDLLNAGVDAVVVPIQGVSTLDDGFVASCRAVFRTQAWSHLTVVVQRKYHGSIPVGEAVLVSTGLSGVKWMIAAPARHADEFVGLRVQGDCLAGRVILPGPDRNLASSKDQLRGAGAMTQASSGQSGASMRDPVAVAPDSRSWPPFASPLARSRSAFWGAQASGRAALAATRGRAQKP